MERRCWSADPRFVTVTKAGVLNIFALLTLAFYGYKQMNEVWLSSSLFNAKVVRFKLTLAANVVSVAKVAV